MHLRASAHEDAQHAATLLGDALRTASLPAADEGRVVVIRRLALGRISARVSPASMALHVERVARNVMSEAVVYNLPAAGGANAVVFPDRSQAIIALAGLHAHGSPADDWFWPEVVHGWRTDASGGERWSLLLQAAHGVPEAVVTAAVLIDRAIQAGVEDALLSSVPAGQGARWLRLEGWSSASPDASPPPWKPPALRRRETIRRWRQTWGPHDDRLVWLTTLLTVVEHPACAADPRLPARVAFALKTFRGVSPSHGVGPRQQDHRHDVISADDGADIPVDKAADGIVTHAVRPIQYRNQPGETLEGASAPHSDPRPDGDPEWPVVPVDASWRAGTGDQPFEHLPVATRVGMPEAEHEPRPVAFEPLSHVSHVFTPFAGLLLVVPILERLGFAAFLASHPSYLDTGFPTRLLWFIGQRVGLPPNDPLALGFRAELGGEDDPVPPEIDAVSFTLPAHAGEVLSSPEPRTPLNSPFAAWLTAVRRWSRRHPRIGLTALIRRPGRVHISKTHISASFAFSQIDVRVRRLALDVDPGWVPWMGRVVQFTYRDGHDRG